MAPGETREPGLAGLARAASDPRLWVLAGLWSVALLLAWVHATHRSEPADGWFYDLALALNPWPDPSPAGVLLVEVPTGRPDPDRLAATVRLAAEMGAAGVALMVDLPAEPTPALLAALREAPALVLARLPAPAHDLVDEPVYSPIPEAYRVLGFREGHVLLHPPTLGVHRRQFLWKQEHGRRVDAVERAVVEAQRPVASEAAGTPPDYLVNFLRGKDRVPRIGLAQAPQALSPATVKGRTLLVGYAPYVRTPPVRTPLGDAVPRLVFHGYALQTLLDGAPVHTFGFGTLLLLFTAQVAIGSLLYVRLSLRGALWVTGAFVVLVLAAGAFLVWQGFWPAVTELLVLQGLILLAWSLRASLLQQRALRRVLAETSRYTRSRLIPPSFYATEEPWHYIATLLYQTLPLNRMALLERIPGLHRVRVVPCPHCFPESEIMERRRDFLRTPYTTALAQPRPLALQRPFFHPRGDLHEPQYLLGLSFAGEVQGFWAFSFTPGTEGDQDKLLAVAETLGRRVAEMLYHRSRWTAHNQRRGTVWRRLGLQEWTERFLAGVTRSLAFVEWRLVSLEQLFHGVEHALVLYDFFGQLLYANRPMEELMRRARIPFYRMSALELLARLAELDENEARRALARVRLEREPAGFPAAGLNDASHTYRLQLRRLARDEGPVSPDEKPFQFEGILLICEDVSLIKAQVESRAALLRAVAAELGEYQRRLSALGHGSAQPTGLEDTLQTATERLQRRLTAALRDLLQGCDVVEDPPLPVQLKPLLQMAVEAVRPLAEQKALNIVVETPPGTVLVRLASNRFVRGLRAVLERLVEDARRGGRLLLRVEISGQEALLRLEDEGYGLPQEELDASQAPGAADTPDPLRRFASALQEWGGRLSATGGLGIGIRIEIRLPLVF